MQQTQFSGSNFEKISGAEMAIPSTVKPQSLRFLESPKTESMLEHIEFVIRKNLVKIHILGSPPG